MARRADAHVRDVRSLLLLKLVHAERSRRDTGALLERQRSLVRPLVEAHEDRIRRASRWHGPSGTVEL